MAALTRASAIDLTAAAGLGPVGRELPSRRRERAWVRGAQAGSHEAMEALFRAHWARAHRAAFLIVHDAAAAEDIAQEAFLAAIRALHRFDRRRPFGPWLHRIVVNRAIDWSRARALRGEVAEPTEREAPPAAPGRVVGRGGGGSRRRSIPTSVPPWCCATCSSTRRARSPSCSRCPRGTVNSRLRRALDRLAEELGPLEARS